MAVKRHVVKQQPIPRVKATKVSTYHAHGCTECELRYADACSTPEVNGVCMSCRTGQDISIERLDRCPKDCCTYHSVQIEDSKVLNQYDLAGPGPWWICKGPHGCFRTHPFDPRPKESR